jgi:hypothetical protein
MNPPAHFPEDEPALEAARLAEEMKERAVRDATAARAQRRVDAVNAGRNALVRLLGVEGGPTSTGHNGVNGVVTTAPSFTAAGNQTTTEGHRGAFGRVYWNRLGQELVRPQRDDMLMMGGRGALDLSEGDWTGPAGTGGRGCALLHLTRLVAMASDVAGNGGARSGIGGGRGSMAHRRKSRMMLARSNTSAAATSPTRSKSNAALAPAIDRHATAAAQPVAVAAAEAGGGGGGSGGLLFEGLATSAMSTNPNALSESIFNTLSANSGGADFAGTPTLGGIVMLDVESGVLPFAGSVLRASSLALFLNHFLLTATGGAPGGLMQVAWGLQEENKKKANRTAQIVAASTASSAGAAAPLTLDADKQPTLAMSEVLSTSAMSKSLDQSTAGLADPEDRLVAANAAKIRSAVRVQLLSLSNQRRVVSHYFPDDYSTAGLFSDRGINDIRSAAARSTASSRLRGTESTLVSPRKRHLNINRTVTVHYCSNRNKATTLKALG